MFLKLSYVASDGHSSKLYVELCSSMELVPFYAGYILVRKMNLSRWGTWSNPEECLGTFVNLEVVEAYWQIIDYPQSEQKRYGAYMNQPSLSLKPLFLFQDNSFFHLWHHIKPKTG